MNRNKIIAHQGKEPSAEPINITAGETWTVGDIKSIIQAKTSLPVYSRLLIMNNHQKLLFENHAKVDTFHSWPEPYVLTFFQKFNTHKSVDVDQKLPGLEHWIRRPDTLDWYLEVHVLNKDQNNWPIINIRIRSIANVLQLKMKIDEHGGIPTVRQDLVALLMPINQGPLCASLLDWYKLEDVIPNATGQYRIFLTERGRSNTKPAKMVVKNPIIYLLRKQPSTWILIVICLHLVWRNTAAWIIDWARGGSCFAYNAWSAWWVGSHSFILWD